MVATGVAVARHRHVDDVGLDRAHLLVAEAPVPQHARTEVLDHEVGDGDQPLDDLQPLGTAHVQTEALFVDVGVVVKLPEVLRVASSPRGVVELGRRPRSFSGHSILMISAPRAPSQRVAQGPASDPTEIDRRGWRPRHAAGTWHPFSPLPPVWVREVAADNPWPRARPPDCAFASFRARFRQGKRSGRSGKTRAGKSMDFDTIIVGGGSAGSVLGSRLSARGANRVLICEAGQDTPPGAVPKEILDSYSGTAYLDKRFHWTELKVSTEVVSHNNPDAPKPRLRKYEQARVLGGGSSINGQMANRGAPTDYDEWGVARRRRLVLERRAAVLQETRTRPGHRRRVARQGRPHPDPPRARIAVAGPRQGAGAGVPGVGLQIPSRSERVLRGRVLSRHDLQRRRAAGVGGDRLPERRGAETRQPDHLHRHAGHGAAVRGHALRRRQGAGERPADGVPRPRGDRVLGRDPFAGASVAGGDLGRSGICAISASRCATRCPASVSG